MPIDPLRVLLVSRDRRFLRVTSFLFTRDGAEVCVGRTRADAAQIVEDGGVDLVVLDSGDSLGEAAAFVLELQEHYPGLLIVVVTDGAVRSPQRLELTLWPKWQHLSALPAMAGQARRLRKLPAAQASP